MRAITAKSFSVAILAYDGLALLEFAAACEVFGDVDPATGHPRYEILVCGVRRGEVTVSTAGLRLRVPYALSAATRAQTVVVPPCDDPRGVPPQAFAAIRRAHARGARIISLCTGAAILAEAGILDGRRATTHWAEADKMARRFPSVTIDPGVLYVDEGDILTSAGSAASIDLCLHVVRQDLGAEVASRIARELVVPPFREGGQAQYIEMPVPEPADSDLFADTVDWVQGHLDEPVTVEELARRSAMSRRTFARRFAASTGTTPYQWLLRQRLQRAQQLLETTDLAIDLVAERSGFQNAGNLRKQFHAVLRTTPQAYRRTFRSRTRPQTLAG
ncbi:MAG TPA: helix-turn-helix domain-containing protein [Frankiaceae bacterium]|nr:helix-turn-helix domain-containing protein [Frankiaceae bacterium]